MTTPLEFVIYTFAVVGVITIASTIAKCAWYVYAGWKHAQSIAQQENTQ